MYLFGSKLIRNYFSDFRKTNDTDWVTNDQNEMLKSIVGEEEYYFIPCTPDREMSPDEIYTVKVSHAIYDIKWQKTMGDIRFLQMKGCKIIPEFLMQLREHWKTIHKSRRTDFDVESDQFFNDKVKREIEHDELHKLINPTPTYTSIVDGVIPSIDKYNKLSDSDKIELLFEEAFVISCERYNQHPDKYSYFLAQKDLVTRLHPLWMADIVIENWNKNYWNCSKSKYYENYINLKQK
jgi:hypothetical protein